jgi:hypothetical protein
MTKQKFCYLTAAFGLALFTSTGQADPLAERESFAMDVAKEWFVSLVGGETDKTLAVSAVPFSFDRKFEVKTLPELKKLYDQVVEKKGKRHLKVGSARIKNSTPELIEVILTIEDDDEGISITVRPGKDCRVIGFSD